MVFIFCRYLATGDTFQSLSFYFARGQSTISKIVAETTEAIWNTLKHDYMSLPQKEHWKAIANRFWEVWNLPNCLGALDGKHIRIQKIPKTGSSNFNYKGYHSIVLMACSDADGIFTTIETGFAGRNSDGGIFRESRLGRWLERLEKEGLNLPEDAVLPHDESGQAFPHYFVGDEAFPLKRYMMRPFPQRVLNNSRRIFNYRLSRGRKTVECAFGMMTQKFQILKTAILSTKHLNITNIVKCCCILHNFIRTREGRKYQNLMQVEALGNICTRPREIIAENSFQMPRRSPQNLRNYLANFFITDAGALPWQWQYCVYERENF